MDASHASRQGESSFNEPFCEAPASLPPSDGVERARVLIAEGLAPRLQRLAVQRLGGGVVALLIQQQAEADGDECIWVLMKASRSISST